MSDDAPAGSTPGPTAGPHGVLDADARAYVDAIPAERRPLFDRVHGLILAAHPDVQVVLSYKLPTYVVGRHRLYVGVWKNWLSFYGWEPDQDGGFGARHPELLTNKGTLKLRPRDAAQISDAELTEFVRAALGG